MGSVPVFDVLRKPVSFHSAFFHHPDTGDVFFKSAGTRRQEACSGFIGVCSYYFSLASRTPFAAAMKSATVSFRHWVSVG